MYRAILELLDKNDFEVIPLPFYDVLPFGGGMHCAAVDIYREGTCEDNFPKQVEGFEVRALTGLQMNEAAVF